MFKANSMAQNLGFIIAPGAWMAFIFFLSTLEGPASGRVLESVSGTWTEGWLSYLAHALLYGILAILVQSAIWVWDPQRQPKWVFVAGLFAAVYGITDEYHQSFVVGRSASASDVVVDSVAALVAAALLWFWTTRFIRVAASVT